MMVESLEKLNRICQKPDYKTKGNWYVRTILRDAALPVTWLLLHTRVTANQVTLLSLVVSFVGVIFLSIPGINAFLTGVILLQLWYYLDHVDGQIARYRKTDCLTGRFLDFLTHHIVHTALFFSLGFYVFQLTGSVLFVLWGFVAALAILAFNVAHDVKYKTFFEKLEMSRTTKDLALKRKKNSPPNDFQGTLPFGKRLFSIAHKLCEIHVMMNILTVGVLVQIFFATVDVRTVLFLAYGLLAPAIAIIKVAFIVKTKKIDQEYQELFSPQKS